MTPKELDRLFKVDKSNWLSETNDGHPIWDMDKVNKFWKYIEIEKINKNDYIFNDFKFPTFSNTPVLMASDTQSNFFFKVFGSNGKLIKSKILFTNCTFQGDTNFLGAAPGEKTIPDNMILVENNISFTKCIFEKEFRIRGQHFLKNFNISDCHFHGDFHILFSSFKGLSYIHSSTFYKNFNYVLNTHFGRLDIASNTFNNLTFLGQNTYFSNLSFSNEVNGKITFNTNTYKSGFSLHHSFLNHSSFFQDEKYSSANFQDIEFSNKKHSFEKIHLSDKSTIKFRNALFPKSAIFHNCDIYKMSFTNSDVTEVKFSSCNWDSKRRLIIFDEKEKKDSIIELKQLENLYRQFKKNFENFKDWELSGKAYISEMTIRKKRHWKEKNYLSWWIFLIYDCLGAYTQDYIRPLKWFLLLSSLVFPFYYTLFENFNLFHLYPYADFSISNAFKKSFAAAIPLIKTDLIYYNWWMQSLQVILSTILLTFFVLALRKRFKQ